MCPLLGPETSRSLVFADGDSVWSYVDLQATSTLADMYFSNDQLDEAEKWVRIAVDCAERVGEGLGSCLCM